MASTKPDSSNPSTTSTMALPTSGIITSNSNSATTENLLLFTVFPKLPLELRRKIWKEACFEPRNIDIWIEQLREDRNFVESNVYYSVKSQRHEYFYRSHSQIPPVLHASVESRAIALEHYSLEFGTDTEKYCGRATIRVSTPAQIFVNWECDVICLVKFPCLSETIMQDLARNTKIKHLALPVYDRAYSYGVFLRHFNLEQLILYSQPALNPRRSKFQNYKSLSIQFLAFRCPVYENMDEVLGALGMFGVEKWLMAHCAFVLNAILGRLRKDWKFMLAITV